MSTDYDMIIAGGGIAGLTAGLQSARLGLSCLVLTGSVPGGHLLSIASVDGYPGFADGVPGYDLCPGVQLEAAQRGASFAVSSLESLEANNGQITVKAGLEWHTARTLVLATGTTFKTLGVPGEERSPGKGVSNCASCDAPLLRGAVVAVIGGGDSALQEALTLAQFAERVVLVHRSMQLGGQAAYRAAVHDHPKIDVRLGSTLQRIDGDDVVTGVTLTEGEMEVDGVFVYVGLAPNTGFLKGLVELNTAGQIVTGSSMATGIEGVFAAGTVRAGAAGRAAAAAGEGATAAIAAARYLDSGLWERLQ